MARRAFLPTIPPPAVASPPLPAGSASRSQPAPPSTAGDRRGSIPPPSMGSMGSAVGSGTGSATSFGAPESRRGTLPPPSLAGDRLAGDTIPMQAVVQLLDR